MLKHQYRGDGWHRIVRLDIAGFLKHSGEWASYQNIAVLIEEQKRYVAMTGYFAGTLMPDWIYELAVIPASEYAGSELSPVK